MGPGILIDLQIPCFLRVFGCQWNLRLAYAHHGFLVLLSGKPHWLRKTASLTEVGAFSRLSAMSKARSRSHLSSSSGTCKNALHPSSSPPSPHSHPTPPTRARRHCALRTKLWGGRTTESTPPWDAVQREAKRNPSDLNI